MNKELLSAIEYLSKEKNVSPDVIYDSLEAVLITAYKKEPGANSNAVVALNRNTGDYRIMKKAEPSIPVEILGLNDVPEAGDILNVVDEKTARSVAEKRMEKKRTSELHQHQKVTLDDLFNQIQQGELKELSLIVKGDVQGSVEALSQSLESIKSEEVRIAIVHVLSL